MFKNSGRHRDFLEYVVEETLKGRAGAIKEYSIGAAVFARGEKFDPRVDTIVRTEARRLRRRLQEYYEGEGRSDSIRIELIKGNYAPIFHVPQDLTQKFSSDGAASIAVLPFANLSNDREADVLADGLAEELIRALARVPGINVAARSSAFQFRGHKTGIEEIGRRLKVRNVLEGSVRKWGRQIGLTVRLLDSVSGRVLWAERYEREVWDPLGLERELCAAIVTALGEGLSVGGKESLLQSLSQPPRGVDLEAYQDYLRGRYFMRRFTAPSLAAAIECMCQAASRDPQFAAAHAALACCFGLTVALTDAPAGEMAPQIRASASRALELDPNSSEAHRALGFAHVHNYEWPEAERELRQSVELSPGDAEAHYYYAHFLKRICRLEEALREFETAAALDPGSPIAIQGVGIALTYLHRFDAADQHHRRALAIDPDWGLGHEFLGLTCVFRGQYAEGIKELQTACKIQGRAPGFLGHLGYAYGMSKDRPKAHQIVGEMLARSDPKRAVATAIAAVYIGLGDYDRAFQALQEAADHRDGTLVLASPIYDPLRTDPRYFRLLKSMRLPQGGASFRAAS